MMCCMCSQYHSRASESFPPGLPVVTWQLASDSGMVLRCCTDQSIRDSSARGMHLAQKPFETYSDLPR